MKTIYSSEMRKRILRRFQEAVDDPEAFLKQMEEIIGSLQPGALKLRQEGNLARSRTNLEQGTFSDMDVFVLTFPGQSI